MSLTKQAKILTTDQITKVFEYLETHGPYKTRHRNKIIFALSVLAGLRVKEISTLTWGMVTNSSGTLSNTINLTNTASKGLTGGRHIPIHPKLYRLLKDYTLINPPQTQPIIYSTATLSLQPLTPNSLAHWFKNLYTTLGFQGCSSHSGRRTFLTNLARKVDKVNCSLRDIQVLAGHSNISTTQRYIEVNSTNHKKLVGLLLSEEDEEE